MFFNLVVTRNIDYQVPSSSLTLWQTEICSAFQESQGVSQDFISLRFAS